MTPEIEALEEKIRATGCPHVEWAGGLGGIVRSRNARTAWRQANPEAAARYDMLAAELDAAHAAMAATEAAEKHAAALERMLKACGLRPRDIDAARVGEDRPALAAARKWFAGNATWLAMLGRTGAGKTVAAAWCVLQVLQRGGTAQYRGMADVSRLSSFDEGRADLERLKRLELLVLDDVGTEHLTAHAGGLVFDLLDARHAARRRTVVCSNLDGKALVARLGERLADRIQSDGVVVHLAGASMRRTTLKTKDDALASSRGVTP